MFLEVLIASLIVIFAALGGAISFFKTVGNFIERNLGFLISFTAGLFLFVSYELGKEAISHAMSPQEALFWIMGGAVFIWLIFKIIPHAHDHSKKEIDVRKLLTGNGIHNIGDGVLLAAAFSVDFSLGVITTVSVFIHELAQETSIFFVLRKAGYSIKKAILINLGVSSTILVGSLGGFFLLSFFSKLETPLLGISTGAFFIVVLLDLIPHSIHESKKDKCLPYHIVFFLFGLSLMFFFSLLFPHTHDHHDHNHQSDHHHESDHHHNNHHH